MTNGTMVPYMDVSDGQGLDLPEKGRLDAPWFCRPDPLYFPGYMFPRGGVPGNLLGGTAQGVNGIYDAVIRRYSDVPMQEL